PPSMCDAAEEHSVVADYPGRRDDARSTCARPPRACARATAVHDPSQTWLPRDASVPRNSILVGGASLARWQPLNYHCAFTRAIAKPTSIGGMVMDRRGFIRSVAVAGAAAALAVSPPGACAAAEGATPTKRLPPPRRGARHHCSGQWDRRGSAAINLSIRALRRGG